MAQGTDPSNPPHTITRSHVRKVTFDDVVKGVMEIEDNDLLLKALDNAGLDSVADLITLTDPQIDALVYDDGTTCLIPSFFQLQQASYPMCLELPPPTSSGDTSC